MSNFVNQNLTLIAVLWPRVESKLFIRTSILALIGSALLALSSKIQVPVWPVPITMQTFAILVIGMTYGWRLGAATVLLYLAEGAIGIPVFAAGGGIAHLTGPTAGYLLGFVFAAAVVGYLAEKGWDRKVYSTLIAMLLGNLVIYVPGLLWLGTVVGYGKVFAVGLAPFLLGDFLKIGLAAVLLPSIWSFIRKR